MTLNDLREMYYSWVCSLAFPNEGERFKYSKLLDYLYNRRFDYSIPLDENRYSDGIDLRYRFGYEYSINHEDIGLAFDCRECSILEMMVALSLRCEEHIMSNDIVGNRIGFWFAGMLDNLQISGSTDDNYDEKWVEYRIDCLLNHNYEPNGEGGLFTVDNPRKDMRETEIWYQMCWYLDSVLKRETY